MINPDEVVSKYGADTVRGYLMFIGPWDQGGPWDHQRHRRRHRFLYRVCGRSSTESEAEFINAEPQRRRGA